MVPQPVFNTKQLSHASRHDDFKVVVVSNFIPRQDPQTLRFVAKAF